jgi:hypothetical protein
MLGLPDLKGWQSSWQSGDRGEALACRYLENKGYAGIERNYRTRSPTRR